MLSEAEIQCLRIESESVLSPDDLAVVQNGMRRHTESQVPWQEYSDRAVVARRASGQLVGAAIGEVGRGWLHVSIVWVDAQMRGRGLGTKLLTSLEILAVKEGCRAAYLNTFSYQARPFYAKLGYEVFGTLNDYPPGHMRFFMQKRLAS
jgi:GNAT superfamily N-acetyltransferase